MEVEILAGRERWVLRGGKHAYELGRPTQVVDKLTGAEKEVVTIEKWYSNLPSALNAIADMKLRASDANTLKDMYDEVKRIRQEITAMTDFTFDSAEPVLGSESSIPLEDEEEEE